MVEQLTWHRALVPRGPEGKEGGELTSHWRFALHCMVPIGGLCVGEEGHKQDVSASIVCARRNLALDHAKRKGPATTKSKRGSLLPGYVNGSLWDTWRWRLPRGAKSGATAGGSASHGWHGLRQHVAIVQALSPLDDVRMSLITDALMQ